MDDLSPDAIAQLATRMYNEMPGASAVPTSQVAAQQAPQQHLSAPRRSVRCP